ncbi:MAG: hypothetical protein H2065_05335 [Candidatus Poseidoniales archaeon]|nr:hypothetical protein [Candidatus Poseidoniales archaeon]
MEWLKEAGWEYDEESNSIESVEYWSPYVAMIPFVIILIFFSLILTSFKSNGLINDEEFFFSFLIVFGVVFCLYGPIYFLLIAKGLVRRISLADLSYTLMHRNRRTFVNSKIRTLESSENFVHRNLEVVVVENVRIHGGDGGVSRKIEYQVRLMDKRFTGEERYFTHQTLHPDLRIDVRRTRGAYHKFDSSDNYQRLLVRNARNRSKAIQLRDRFQEFFIEGGWQELTEQIPPVISDEATNDGNEPFWV